MKQFNMERHFYALIDNKLRWLVGSVQKYFSKKLLPHAVQLLVLAQFGQKVPFPREQGATTIRFTRGDTAAAANVLAGGEGIPTTTFRDYTYTFIDATLVEYEIAAKISDVLSWTNLFDTLKNMTGVMGEDVALHADSKIRDSIVAGVTGAGNRRYVSTAATQDFTGVQGTSQTTGVMTILDLLDAMTRLTITRAPMLNGEYVACPGAQVCRDILNDPKVVLAGQYGTSKGLLTGEVGRWYGVRIVKQTNPFIEDGTGSEGTYAVPVSAANAIYRTFVMGTDGFGIPQMGGLSPFNPQLMICDKPDKSDQLGSPYQLITAGKKNAAVSVEPLKRAIPREVVIDPVETARSPEREDTVRPLDIFETREPLRNQVAACIASSNNIIANESVYYSRFENVLGKCGTQQSVDCFRQYQERLQRLNLDTLTVL